MQASTQQSINRSRQDRSRYVAGVQSLKPDLVAKIHAALAADPTMTKSALARAVGVSRATVGYYLRGLGDAVARADDKRAKVERGTIDSTRDLVQHVLRSGDEIRQEIEKLRTQSPTVPTASAIFRGYAVLERYLRLSGELLGEISPPTQNVYVMQVAALLARPVDPSTLSPVARAALGIERG